VKTDYYPGRTETVLTIKELQTENPLGRWNPGYFEDRYIQIEHHLRSIGAAKLGKFIPETLEGGSRGITYGQVGARVLSALGAVRYLQVINIRETGIDFAIKPDRVAEGSHNDPERSRLRLRDILFTNNAFRGTDTLLGRCVVVHRDYGQVNISQHIDRIRVRSINPFYVCSFLKTKYGRLQIERVTHGVDSTGISFGRIRDILIPELSAKDQELIQESYLSMAKHHDRAMAIKEKLLEDTGVAPGLYGETINALAEKRPAYRRAMKEATDRLTYLIAQLETVIEGRQRKLKPYPA